MQTGRFPTLKLDAGHAATLVLLVSLLLAYLTVFPDAWQVRFDDLYGELIFLSLTNIMFARALLRANNRNVRMFWGLLLIAFGIWLLVQLTIWALPESLPARAELSKDIVFLIFFAALIATIELRLDQHADDRWLYRRAPAAIGGILLVVASFGYFVILPLAVGESGYESTLTLHAVFDGYIGLRFLAAAVQARDTPWRRQYALLGIGFVLLAGADLLAWAFTEGMFAYVAGSPLNLLWWAWYPVVIIATGVELRGTEKSLDDRSTEDEYPNTNALLFFGLSLPLIHVSGYALGLLDPDARLYRDLLVAFWLVAIGAVLFGLYRFIYGRIDVLQEKRADAETRALKFEQQLNRTLRLRSLGRLSSGLAHDFGNTMTALEMHAVTAERRVERGEPSKAEFEGVRNCIDYARNMVAQLKLFGAADERVDTESVSMADEVENTLELIRPSLPDGVSLSFSHGAAEGTVKARPSMLHQVVANYLHNAIDAVHESGTIDVIVEYADVSDRCRSCGNELQGRYAMLKVCDSGDGVSWHLAEHIFEPLVTTKPVGLGSGLGLASVHGIMHKLGGHVGLATSPTGGACFIAYFPLSESG